MGYNTYFTGQIRIEPPLSWAEIRDSEFLPDRAWDNGFTVKLNVVEETVETDDGTLARRWADAIVPVTDDRYKAYDIVAHVQRLVDRYGNSHAFTGRLDAAGEDAGDLWRLTVRDGRAVKIQPQLVWPDDPEGGER
jgi:hypothetical protein